MFKKLLKNKKAQQSAEYALLISLVIAAVVAMQTYAQRTLQSRIRGGSNYLVHFTDTTGEGIGGTAQYEPYYLDSQYDVTRADTTTELHDDTTISKAQDALTTRGTGGFKSMSFDTSAFTQTSEDNP